MNGEDRTLIRVLYSEIFKFKFDDIPYKVQGEQEIVKILIKTDILPTLNYNISR